MAPFVRVPERVDSLPRDKKMGGGARRSAAHLPSVLALSRSFATMLICDCEEVCRDAMLAHLPGEMALKSGPFAHHRFDRPQPDELLVARETGPVP